METINLNEKFSLFKDLWSPQIIAQLNGQHVKLAKLSGDFEWHKHELEDEFFYVIKGELKIELEEKEIVLHEGECVVIPKGVLHKPKAESECWIMLFEPIETINTGDLENEKTVKNPEWI
jgi:mannose-6-phosphate isomerase-like protein (cupin superfamily)